MEKVESTKSDTKTQMSFYTTVKNRMFYKHIAALKNCSLQNLINESIELRYKILYDDFVKKFEGGLL